MLRLLLSLVSLLFLCIVPFPFGVVCLSVRASVACKSVLQRRFVHFHFVSIAIVHAIVSAFHLRARQSI
jgi:ABC-type polysaccharide transport system permease subunit